jgi:Domain of unknown function (DUF3786)
MKKKYLIISDPEANILYQKCRNVDEALWKALLQADHHEVAGRTGATYQGGVYELPFLNRTLVVDPAEHLVRVQGLPGGEPEFQLCLTVLLFLLKVNTAQLPSRLVSPKEYRGGMTFFQGPHALPTARLEERFGTDRDLFLKIGRSLGGEEVGQGDAAILLPTYPKLSLEVILWLGDEEFPPQVSLTALAALERFWALDAIWAWLNVVTREFWRAAG